MLMFVIVRMIEYQIEVEIELQQLLPWQQETKNCFDVEKKTRRNCLWLVVHLNQTHLWSGGHCPC